MKVWYLYHSGFAVETDHHVLIFDYYKNKPRYAGFPEGVVDPQQLVRKKVDVFVSHRHADHYNQTIYKWRYDLRYVRYFLSEDIVPPEDVTTVTLVPGKEVSLEDINIKVFPSNDEGVAVLVRTPWATIFHAGDLNWWDWTGESAEYRAEMKQTYCEQIDLLRGTQIDLAFIPADPRLGTQFALAVDYFMRNVGAGLCVPMHLDGDYKVCDRLISDPCTDPYRDQIWSYSERGQCIELPDRAKHR